MAILIVGITQAKALVLDLAAPAASKRQKGRIATYPLLTTRRFDQRRLGIAAEPTMLASNRLRFHAIVSHGISLGGGKCNRRCERHRGASRRGLFSRNRHLKPATPSKTGLMGKFWYNGLSLYALKPVA